MIVIALQPRAFCRQQGWQFENEADTKMIHASMKQEQAVQKKALQEAEKNVEKARKEYTALQDEIMKALMGEG